MTMFSGCPQLSGRTKRYQLKRRSETAKAAVALTITAPTTSPASSKPAETKADDVGDVPGQKRGQAGDQEVPPQHQKDVAGEPERQSDDKEGPLGLADRVQ